MTTASALFKKMNDGPIDEMLDLLNDFGSMSALTQATIDEVISFTINSDISDDQRRWLIEITRQESIEGYATISIGMSP